MEERRGSRGAPTSKAPAISGAVSDATSLTRPALMSLEPYTQIAREPRRTPAPKRALPLFDAEPRVAERSSYCMAVALGHSDATGNAVPPVTNLGFDVVDDFPRLLSGQ